MDCFLATVLPGSRANQQFKDSIHMANSKQARKRARQNIQANLHNAPLRSQYRTAVKGVRKAIAAGNKEAAVAAFRAAQKVLDTIADKKIVHKNKAARHKSRLSAAVKGMGAAA